MKQILICIALALAVPVVGWAEKATYLGVIASPADDTVKNQLNLTSGVIVKGVQPDSPASVVLKKHDILTKLDDQLLMNPSQLIDLVKSKKTGDKVTVDFMRVGKMHSGEIVLGEREVKESEKDVHVTEIFPGISIEAIQPGNLNMQLREHKQLREKMKKIQSQNDQFKAKVESSIGAGGEVKININGQEIDLGKFIDLGDFKNLNNLDANTTVITSTGAVSSISWSENGTTFLMNTTGDDTTLKITEDGKVVFEGPCNNDADRKKIPKKYQDKVKQIRMKTGGVKIDIQR